jgi:predicted ATPase
LRDSLTAQLDQLSDAKAVAQLASVLGREFDYALLRSVCQFPEEELEAHLAALNRANIIQQSGDPPSSHYVFRHALIQEAAYDSLLKSVRQQHHQRVANSYVDRFPLLTQSRPELVALHYSRGRMPEAALTYWQKAGELAVGRTAYEEAIAHLDSALEQIELLPDSQARAASELGLRVTIGPALTARLGMGAARTGENYSRACQLAEKLGEQPLRFMAMWGDWMFTAVSGQLVRASHRSEDLVALSRKLEADEFSLQAFHSRWSCYLYLGDVKLVRADTSQGIHLYDAVRHRHHKHLYGGHDPGVCAHCFGANAAWLAGHTAEALAIADNGLALAREIDHSFSLSTAHMWKGFVLQCANEHEAAQAAANQLIAVCEQHDFKQWKGAGLILLGASRTMQGEVEVGLKLIEQGLIVQRKFGQMIMFNLLAAFAAEAHLQGGNHARALELLSEAIEASDRTSVTWYRPEVQRLRAQTLFQSGLASTTETILRIDDAAKLARNQGAIALEWRAATSLARLLAQNGQAEQARERLREVCGVLSEGLDSSELDAARADLAALA